MRYPNAYKGVKKIYLGEMLMLAAAVLGIVLVFMGAIGSNSTLQLNENDPKFGIVAGLALAIGLVVIVAFFLVLIGIINAKKDDENFRVALYAVLLGIVLSVVESLVGNKYPQIQHWLKLGVSICSLFSTYYVLGGVGSLAEKMGNDEVKALADKARNVLCFMFAASALLKLIPEFTSDATVSLVINSLGAVLEIVSYGFYLVVLAKGKKMLAD